MVNEEKKINISEYNIQKTFHEWCGKQDFILLSWHCPNGFTSNGKNANLMKRIGLRNGCPDYWLITSKPELLVIEFKKRGGVVSKEQKEFLSILDRVGIANKICYSAFEASSWVRERMGIKLNGNRNV